MQNLADAIALQALYQSYLRWVNRSAVLWLPLNRREFAHAYRKHCNPLPFALPALWA